MGKALLTCRSANDIRLTLQAEPLQRFTRSTITDVGRLCQEIEAARKQGFAVSNREYFPNTICIGAPIINPIGKAVMAISISIRGYPEPTPARLAELGKLVSRTAADIAAYIVGPRARKLLRPVKELESD
jgi:DNA-binding IclR family transcriptional regulator